MRGSPLLHKVTPRAAGAFISVQVSLKPSWEQGGALHPRWAFPLHPPQRCTCCSSWAPVLQKQRQSFQQGRAKLFWCTQHRPPGQCRCPSHSETPILSPAPSLLARLLVPGAHGLCSLQQHLPAGLGVLEPGRDGSGGHTPQLWPLSSLGLGLWQRPASAALRVILKSG